VIFIPQHIVVQGFWKKAVLPAILHLFPDYKKGFDIDTNY